MTDYCFFQKRAQTIVLKKADSEGVSLLIKHELVTPEGMEKAVAVIVRIAELTAKRG